MFSVLLDGKLQSSGDMEGKPIGPIETPGLIHSEIFNVAFFSSTRVEALNENFLENLERLRMSHFNYQLHNGIISIISTK